MSSAYFRDRRFVFEDDAGQMTTLFSPFELQVPASSLLTCLRLPEGQSKEDWLSNRVIRILKDFGDGSEAMGKSLAFLSCLARAAAFPALRLLVIGCKGGDLAEALAEVLPVLSLDGRVYFLDGEGQRESAPGSSFSVPLPQSTNQPRLPGCFFDGVVLLDGTDSLPGGIINDVRNALRPGGEVYVLSEKESFHHNFSKSFPRRETLAVAPQQGLFFDRGRISREDCEKIYGSRYPGFPFPNTQVSCKKTVLFLPATLADWKEMQDIYRSALFDRETYTALVMPLPYASAGEEPLREWNCDAEGIGKDTHVLPYSQIDMEKLHPDIIVIAQAYHGRMQEIAVPEEYYALRLQKKTGKLLCLSDEKDWRKHPSGGDKCTLNSPPWRGYMLCGGNCWEAERFYYRFPLRDEIQCCTYLQKDGNFHGHEVVTLPDVPEWKYYLLIVATNWGEYQQRWKKPLEERGMVEFRDFWYAEAYLKKIALIHANCYGYFYTEFLKKSQAFTKEYFIYTIPFLNVAPKYIVEDGLLAHCDLFLYQDIRKDNRFGFQASDDYLLPRLKLTCKKLVLPNLVPFAKYFYPPDLHANIPPKKLRCPDATLFVGNRIIDQAFEQGNSLQEIVRAFTDANIISDGEKQKIRDYFFEGIEKLQEREKKWDVRVSDYILRHYKTEKVIVDQSHPSKSLIREICIRLGKALGLEQSRDCVIEFDYEICEYFVMPCIKEALGMEWKEDMVRVHTRPGREPGYNKLCDGKMDVEEYVREYVYWKYGKLLD